jgi:large subunit ribosomal protein L18
VSMMKRHIEVFRRRREGKTDYKKRKALITSRLPFVRTFVSSHNVYAQLIKAAPSGDVTLVSASSTQLPKFGWKGAKKNIPACYLTGLLLAKKSQAFGVEDAVLYTGLSAYRSGSRFSAIVKGALDGGLKVRVSEDSLPPEERLSGSHISSYAASMKKSDPDLYNLRFGRMISAGLEPENLGQNFAQVKEAITNYKPDLFRKAGKDKGG